MIVLNALRFHISSMVSSQIQREPTTNREPYGLTNQSDHNTGYKNNHSINHIPISIPNDNCFTLIDFVEPSNLHDLSFHNSDACQIVKALQRELMVMSDPHHIDKVSRQDQIELP